MVAHPGYPNGDDSGGCELARLKGITGDTGVPFLNLAAGGAVAGGSFVVQSTGAENCLVVWY